MRWCAFLLAAGSLCAEEPVLPAWLANFPGVEAQTSSAKSIVEVTYLAPAKPGEVAAHYRKLFQEQNLAFAPSFDGVGTVVRGAAAECDLMISIRAQGSRTAVRVDCTARTPSGDQWTPVGGAAPSPRFGGRVQASADQMMARHAEIARQIHQRPPDQPAPPLVWPDWLVHVNGRKLSPQSAVDQSHHDVLKCRYVTSQPMSAIYNFYKEALHDNGYDVYSASLETGHTMSGVVQNALGHVDGSLYPNGHPGPRSEIQVYFSRFALNDPITVNITFTTYAYKAPPPFGQ